jgi:hypothetical protein
VTAASSLADSASPVILMFLKLNLFLKLCNYPLLAVRALVTSSIPSFIESPRTLVGLMLLAVTLCRQGLPSSYSRFFTQKFKAFYKFINISSRAIAVTFAVCGTTEKLTQNFLSSLSLHEWKVRSCHTS